MKVIIVNATGSVKEEALLDKDSGVIELSSGEITHILFEKQFGKKIFVVKEVKKEAPLEEVKAPSVEQSEPRPAKKTKRK